MISRVWHGWTTPENADRYEELLKEKVFSTILAKGVGGYRGVHLLRRDLGPEVEFTTIMWFDSLDAVRDFAGPEYDWAYVPAEARALLSRFDPTSQHYEVRQALEY